MDKRTDRVILIRGDASKWYDQAIFIVNKDMPYERIPVDFVAEAEQIISSYINKNRNSCYLGGYGADIPPALLQKIRPIKKERSARSNFDLAVNIMMLIGCLLVAGSLIFGWL